MAWQRPRQPRSTPDSSEPTLFGAPEGAVIRSIAATKRDPERAMVRVGLPGERGKVAATLALKLIAELGLKVGLAWDDKLAAEVAQTVHYDKAMRDAMKRLTSRAMTRSMLARKLQERGHDAAATEQVLDRLEELDLIDDETFGRTLIRDVLSGKAAGPRLLMQKLRQKGISGKLAERLIDEASEPLSDPEPAIELARKRLATNTLRKLDPQARRRRIYGLLARRGFSGEIIDTVMSTLADELSAGGPEEEWD